jgi:hypothetical protein
MPVRSMAKARGVLGTDDLNNIDDVFQRACHNLGIDRLSEQATEVARELIDLYLSGVRSRDALFSFVTRDTQRTTRQPPPQPGTGTNSLTN